MNELTYNLDTAEVIRQMAIVHDRIAQRDLESSQRTLTARNYDSSIAALADWMNLTRNKLPTRTILETWRRDMVINKVAVKTINARLSAVRKLLRSIAADSTDIQIKMVLNDWANIENQKEITNRDKTESDYGVRLPLKSVEHLIKSIDTSTIKGLRDRALIAVMVGAGLRVSEAVALTMRDVFETVNENNQRGIKIKLGKHHTSRVVVLDGWNSWVITAVQAYTNELDLQGDTFIFRPVKYVKGGKWVSLDKSLSKRAAQDAVQQFEVEYLGQTVNLKAHDCRRTYAKLCKLYGMSWEALRDNMGHSSVLVTESYVGKDLDWSERVPKWTINL